MSAVEEVSRLRVPPHSEEAEQALLGCLLNDPESLRAIDVPLSAGVFFRRPNRLVFEAVERLTGQGKAADIVSVFVDLRERGSAEEAGGMPYLNALAQCVPGAANVGRYAAIVREKAQLRAVVAAADTAAEWAFDGDREAASKAAEVFAAIERAQVAKAPRSLASIAAARTAHYEALERGDVAPGWPTGIPSLDRLLNGGLRPGKLYILAARPAVGKSSLSLAITQAIAGHGLPSLVLSMEMPEEEVADRAVAQAGRLDSAALMSGRMSRDGWERAVEALQHLAERPIYLDDQGALTLAEIKAKARSVRGLKLLVIDYLQLCSGANPKDNRNGQLEEITRGLKAMAKREGIAVLCLSQLNRDVEKRGNKRPTLADLRDSGGIEQDADAVLMLWQARELKEEPVRRIVGCAVTKNRDGATGEIALDFVGAYQRWAESAASLDPLPSCKRTEQFE